MTDPPAVDPSTRRLSDVARHVIIPDGIVDTLWFDVEERCREFGDEFDAWQDGLGQVALGLRADGMFAATIGGVTLSIPRQVAKTFIVMRIVVALCTLFPNLTVIWTAHRTRTATNTFSKMKALVMRPAARIYVQPGSNRGTAIRDANGEQQIPFRNGSVIMFGAREQGFGRGFDEVDIEVFDEAQILTEKALEDMTPAVNQSRFEHGALLFYMGTPPRPVDPGEVFTDRRSEALGFKGEDAADFGEPTVGEDSVYVECSGDSDADPDDQKQWAKANPSFPHRTPLVSLRRLRKQLPASDSWSREALGIWDEISARTLTSEITEELWTSTEEGQAPTDGAVAYGVKFSPNGQLVALSAAVRTDAGSIHVERVDTRLVVDGIRWLVDWLAARSDLIVVDGKAGSGALVGELRRKGVPERRVKRPTVDQVITAHADFVNAVRAGELSHLPADVDRALADSVLCAARRPIGNQGGWGFQPATDDGDVTLAESALLARWGATQAKRSKGRSSDSGRRAVVI